MLQKAQEQVQRGQALLAVNHFKIVGLGSWCDDEVAQEIAALMAHCRILNIADELFNLRCPPSVVALIDRHGVHVAMAE